MNSGPERGALVIVAVSYDSASLNRRMDTLQKAGHIVIPASSRESCLTHIRTATYHLLLIGSTVPTANRKQFVELSRKVSPRSKIISVELPDSQPLALADKRVIAGDEEALLVAVTSLLSGDDESDLEERRR